MKFVQFSLFLCILFLFTSQSFSQVAFNPNSEDPAKPGYCKFEDEDTSFYLKPGHERKHPKHCRKIQCGNDFALGILGCPTISRDSKDNCRFIPGDVGKPYPACCLDVAC